MKFQIICKHSVEEKDLLFVSFLKKCDHVAKDSHLNSSIITHDTTNDNMNHNEYDSDFIKKIRLIFWPCSLLQATLTGLSVYITLVHDTPFYGLNVMITVMLLAGTGSFAALTALFGTQPDRHSLKLHYALEGISLFLVAWNFVLLAMNRTLSIWLFAAILSGLTSVALRVYGWTYITHTFSAIEKAQLPLRFSE
jgi:hypothetical protein